MAITETATETIIESSEFTDEQLRSRRERRRHWYGYLADDNVDHVADRIRQILTGRRYTWVDTNASMPSSAHGVRVSQKLEPKGMRSGEAVNVYRNAPDERLHTGITCGDTYGVWGISTSYATEGDAYCDAHGGLAPRSQRWKHWLRTLPVLRAKRRKSGRGLVWVDIVGGVGDEPDPSAQIQIRQFNGYGEILHWTIKPEYTHVEDRAELRAADLEWAANRDDVPAEAVEWLNVLARQVRHEWLVD